MTLDFNPARMLGMFWPLVPLVALSFWLDPSAWLDDPKALPLVVAGPAVVFGVAVIFHKRWRLELTPDALIHHTLGRTERFEWVRMGPVHVSRAKLPVFIAPRVLHFDYYAEGSGPVAAAQRLLGRNLLAVFGDQSAEETVRVIERYRALHAKNPFPSLTEEEG